MLHVVMLRFTAQTRCNNPHSHLLGKHHFSAVRAIISHTVFVNFILLESRLQVHLQFSSSKRALINAKKSIAFTGKFIPIKCVT